VVPLPLIYVTILYVAFAFYMKYSKLGREIYSVGGNESAAKLSGINVKRVKFYTFIIAGVMAGLGAVLMAARLNSGSPNYGDGLEMSAIAAAVIGGASLSGGVGKIVNTILGAFTIVIVQNGLNLHAVPTSLQSITLGVIIIFAVLIDIWKHLIIATIRKLLAKQAKQVTGIGHTAGW
jgi:ribose transport system permease protein